MQPTKTPYTREDINNRTSDYICFDCGRPFIEHLKDRGGNATTFHKSECGLCKEVKAVTHMRHWNWLRIIPDGEFPADRTVRQEPEKP